MHSTGHSSRVPARAVRCALRTALLFSATAAGTLALGACSIAVQDGDDWNHVGENRPRAATDICRREVRRSYDYDHGIDFDLPELSTSGTTQTIIQSFTVDAKRGRGVPERRTIRCVVTDGVLTEVANVR